MSDRDDFLTLLRQRRGTGLHSLEARRMGTTANPSQRARELAALGTPLRKQRARLGQTWGVRFYLAEHAPAGTTEVEPDRRLAGGKSCEWCSGPVEEKRADARFCCDVCRLRAWQEAQPPSRQASTKREPRPKLVDKGKRLRETARPRQDDAGHTKGGPFPSQPYESRTEARFCAWCGEALAQDQRQDAIYCSDVCRVGAHRADRCTYCGMPADQRDHFVPRSRRRRPHKTMPSHNNLLPACQECNLLASDRLFETVEEKRRWIQGRLHERYARILDGPAWTEAELRELGISLRGRVSSFEQLREIVAFRLSWQNAEPNGGGGNATDHGRALAPAPSAGALFDAEETEAPVSAVTGRPVRRGD